MKLEEVTFVPKASLLFSEEEVSVMMQCSEQHYDGKCKEAGQQGGFLFGINNRSKWDATQRNVLHWREVDTLAKVCEVGQYFPDKERGKIAFGLNLELRRILQYLNNVVPPSLKPA